MVHHYMDLKGIDYYICRLPFRISVRMGFGEQIETLKLCTPMNLKIIETWDI